MVCVSVFVTISSFTNGDDLQGQALSILNPARPADPQRTRIGEPSFNVPFNKRDLPNNQTACEMESMLRSCPSSVVEKW